MKKVKIISMFTVVFLFVCSTTQAQQWAGPNDYFGDIVRLGAVKIGNGTQNPTKMLTLHADDRPVLRFERQGSKWDYEIFADTGGHLRFRGGSNNVGSALENHMVIKGTGHVLIGTNEMADDIGGLSFGHFRLFVKGGILTEEVVVRVNWADYVFADDYKLPSLGEVEQHIQEKGYLHNTPSAQEIQNNGLNVGTITVNQQEKIEELFLHMIALEKRIAELEVENAQLQNRQSGKEE